MKNKLSTILTVLIFSLFICSFFSIEAFAAKKSKGMSEAELTQLTETINDLTKKVYSASLFSPAENKKLIEIKIKLDAATAVDTSNPIYPYLYYKAGILYKAREYKEESIDCFRTVAEMFGDSPYAARAISELKKMGIKIEPIKVSE